MKNPLIILGAGASHDSLRISRQTDQHVLRLWEPPLTNNIFDVSRFGEIIKKYEGVKQLASAISNLTDSDAVTPFDFEEYLTIIESKYPENNYKKLMALRFYLAELFSNISFHYFRDTNNHNHLIYELQNRNLKACIVNYNYDTLLERNISSISTSNKIDSYIQGDIKVIKIHGAYNWRYVPQVDVLKKDVYPFFIEEAKTLYMKYKDQEVDPMTIRNFNLNAEQFNINEYRQHEDNGFPGGRWLYYLPAIAIPIGSKGNHVCPKTHIEALTDELKKVNCILVIGWRAQDEYLLTLLKEHLKRDVKMTIVSSSETGAQEIALKFKDIQQIKAESITISKSEGYSKFMINREYENFLE